MMCLINLAKNYSDDTRGQFGIMASISALALILSLGSAVDISRLMNAKQKAQSFADSIALTAAVFVDQNGGPPDNAQYGFMEGIEYSVSDYDFNIYGSDNATFTVTYDDTKKEAFVSVNGGVPTTFMKVANYSNMGFNISSTVKYRETDFKDPASIMFVLDNSGSMWFDDKPLEAGESHPPDDAVIRIDSLKSSLENFNEYLDEIQSGHPDIRFLRAGMMPYNEDIITSSQVNLNWGALTTGQINAMSPWGATNSSPPMTEAWNQMQNEPAVHNAETENPDPLRYVIFMTDGNNTVGENVWFPREDTNHWRREETKTQCRWRRRRGWYCWDYTDFEYFPSDGPGDDDTDEPSGSGWQEGKFYLTSDYETMQTCTAMKNAGVSVYSIGFALEAGTYATNYWGEVYDQPFRSVDTDTKTASIELLSACATDGDHFILAENAEELEEVFDKIGNDIMLDVIRLSK